MAIARPTSTPTAARRTATSTSLRRGAVAAAGLAVAVGLGGCGYFEEAVAVTYEVEVVSKGAPDPTLHAEYTGRQSGVSPAETTGETVLPTDPSPATFETLGLSDDDLSVTVQGVPGATLRCVVLRDGDQVLDEQESSSEGEGVTCSATL